MKKHKKIYVPRHLARIGIEIIDGGNIWLVRAILKERFNENAMTYKVLVEFVRPQLEGVELRLANNIKDVENLFKRVSSVEDILTGKSVVRKWNGINWERLRTVGNKPNVFMRVKESDHIEGKDYYNFHANCSACGALLYTAENPSTFKEVFPVERPFCFHCGNKVDPSTIETDPEKYCNGV